MEGFDGVTTVGPRTRMLVGQTLRIFDAAVPLREGCPVIVGMVDIFAKKIAKEVGTSAN